MAIWYISWQFGIFRGHLVYFMVIFSLFGLMYVLRKFWGARVTDFGIYTPVPLLA
jgi:hypothetical protein